MPETLRHWRERFLSPIAERRAKAALYDERLLPHVGVLSSRAWKSQFRIGDLMVMHMQIAQASGDAVPLTRDYLFETQSVAIRRAVAAARSLIPNHNNP